VLALAGYGTKPVEPVDCTTALWLKRVADFDRHSNNNNNDCTVLMNDRHDIHLSSPITSRYNTRYMATAAASSIAPYLDLVYASLRSCDNVTRYLIECAWVSFDRADVAPILPTSVHRYGSDDDDVATAWRLSGL